MATISKRFGAFLVEIDPCEDRDSVWVTVTHEPTGLSNSMGLLEDMGEFDELPRDSDVPIRIGQKTLDAIREFADANGY